METNNIEMAVVPQSKIVADAPIARKLLKDGYRIVDIKPKRGHQRESVFVFETSSGFMEKMEEYINDRKAKAVKTEE